MAVRTVHPNHIALKDCICRYNRAKAYTSIPHLPRSIQKPHRGKAEVLISVSLQVCMVSPNLGRSTWILARQGDLRIPGKDRLYTNSICTWEHGLHSTRPSDQSQSRGWRLGGALPRCVGLDQSLLRWQMHTFIRKTSWYSSIT